MNRKRFLQKLKSVCIVLMGLFLLPGMVSEVYYVKADGSWDGGYDDSLTEEEVAAIMSENATAAVTTLAGNELYATSAVLMDASTKRVLYEKNGYEEMAMASTTKIMTCIIALEYGNLDETVKISSYAASMPKVKLGVSANEEYKLRDLLYSLMLESHNDVAVAIAEHIGGSVEGFAALMNQKARDIGAYNTNFVTPNGLDADGHYTTAADLALIGAYAIQNSDFVDITNTSSYSFSDVAGTKKYTVYNKNAFLGQMEGTFGIKTGYTGKAGYCFVGALKRDGKVFVSVVLASGWPPNKTHKWRDTQKLMNYGLNNYSYEVIFSPEPKFSTVKILNGQTKYLTTYISEEISVLINPEVDKVDVKYYCEEEIEAPVMANQTVGFAEIYINGELFRTLPIRTYEASEKIDFEYCLKKIIELCMP